MNKYKTVNKSYEILNEVKKSKFIALVFPCESIQAFEEELALIKAQHKGANHHCYAYRIFDNIVLERYQDDKEPSGTAGLPILDVLRGQDLLQCGLVVVRYFGGTKLGTGGLSRAYSDGARDVLMAAEIVSKETAYIYNISLDYTLSGKVEYYINSEHLALTNTSYHSGVTFQVALGEDNKDQVLTSLSDLCSGQAQIEEVDKQKGYFLDNSFYAD